MPEQIFQPYPSKPTATTFRSTWLVSSVQAMKRRGLFERYLTHLPVRFHDPILQAAAGLWLPVETAVAHYEAMNALGLAESEVVDIGLEVVDRFHNVFFSTIFRMARAAGATPWTVFGHTQKMWDRTWDGGGLAIFKLGPREARGEIVGWPCSRIGYCRIAMRGVMLGTVTLFCKKAWIEERPELCTGTTLGYRMNWI